MANNVVEILKGVVGELREIAKSETIIGEPVTIGDTTVIPIVKISVGFGAGGGQGENDKNQSGFGGGGGGGARIEPAGFIMINKEGASFLPASKGKWDGIIDAIPGLAKKVGKWKDSLSSDKADDSPDSSDSSDSSETTDSDDSDK